MYRWTSLLAALLAALVVIGCSDSLVEVEPPDVAPPEGEPSGTFQVVLLASDTLRMAAKGGALLVAGIQATEGSYPHTPRFMWGSRNGRVATVDRDGVVTARGMGATYVRVTLLHPSGAMLSHDSVLVAVEWEKVIQPGILHPFPPLWLSADGTVYLGTNDGALASTDRGATWQTPALSLPGGLSLRSVYPSPTRVGWMVATGYDAARDTVHSYITSDGGKSWRPFVPTVEGTPFDVSLMRFGADGVLYALSGDDYVLRTRDAGDTWTATPIERGWPINVSRFIADATQPDVLYAEGYEIVRSRNGGRTWETTFPATSGYRFLHVDYRGRMYAQHIPNDWQLTRLSPETGETFEVPLTSGGYMVVDTSPDSRCLFAALNDGEWFARADVAHRCEGEAAFRRMKLPPFDAVSVVRIVHTDPLEALLVTYAVENVSLWRYVEIR